jgi:hypothetical protein
MNGMDEQYTTFLPWRDMKDIIRNLYMANRCKRDEIVKHVWAKTVF